jgi:hypothetical protein
MAKPGIETPKNAKSFADRFCIASYKLKVHLGSTQYEDSKLPVKSSLQRDTITYKLLVI